MTDKLVSVIVPIYNGEKYIQRCVTSILDSTYTNFELLLLNDGSTDDSINICNKLCDYDNRIRFFTHENVGVSKTREIGIQKSKGDYITFIDVDDYIEQDYIEVLINQLNSTQSDIVCCNSTDQSPFSKDIYIHEDITTIDKELFLEGYLHGKRYANCIWAKLFKKDVFTDVVFPELAYAEDAYIVFCCVMHSQRMSLIKYAGYHYSDNQEGAMRRAKGNRMAYDVLRCDLFIYENTVMQYKNISVDLARKVENSLLSYIVSSSTLNEPLNVDRACITKVINILKRSKSTYKLMIAAIFNRNPEFIAKIIGCLKFVKKRLVIDNS